MNNPLCKILSGKTASEKQDLYFIEDQDNNDDVAIVTEELMVEEEDEEPVEEQSHLKKDDRNTFSSALTQNSLKSVNSEENRTNSKIETPNKKNRRVARISTRLNSNENETSISGNVVNKEMVNKKMDRKLVNTSPIEYLEKSSKNVKAFSLQ